MKRRRRWLFVSPAPLGHLFVQLAVVEELRRRGDDVFVFAPARVKKHIEAAGGTAVEAGDGPLLDIEAAMHEARDRSGWKPPSWVTSPRARRFLEAREREMRFRRTVRLVTERTARATRELAARVEAAAVVADVLSFGARFGAELARLPFASIAMDPVFALDERGVPLHLPDARAAGLPPWMWQNVVDLALPLRTVRRALGLARRDVAGPADFYAQMVSSDLHIVPAPAWFMGVKPGPKHVYVGPMAFSPPDAPGAAGAPLAVGERTVMVTGSTTGHPRARAMLTATVRAFAGTDLDVVVTAGPAAALLGDVPANVRVIEGFVRHEDVIPRVGVVVSHGGWGTTGRAMRSGTPSLVVPAFGPQFTVSARVEATGIGRALAIEALSPERVRAAAEELLGAGDIRARAKRVGEELAAAPEPAAQAADALASLVG